MISSAGFDKGSRAVASQTGIVLKTFRQAREGDWKRFLDEDNWLALTTVEVPNLTAHARADDTSQLVRISLKSTPLNTESAGYYQFQTIHPGLRRQDIGEYVLSLEWSELPRRPNAL
jgi:hypothetical protein